MTRLTQKEAKRLGLEQTKKNKYGAKKTVIDNITFASKKEARKYSDLKLLKRAGEIKDRELQPIFVLEEGFTDNAGKKHRPIVYIADFKVYLNDGREQVIDTKGYKTKEYKIKKKLFLKRYPEINFIEE